MLPPCAALLLGLALLVLSAPHASGENGSPGGLAALVAGIVTGPGVIAAGVPLASGPWGTDYLTVSHALGVGRQYAVRRDGLPEAETVPVAACSSQHHGIDVLILRAPSHPSSPVVEWGDPATLRPGDELVGVVRREFHPEPVKLKFLHTSLLEWAELGPSALPVAWRHVMVGEGRGKPGFSGSPWVQHGMVYGLHKGVVQLPGGSSWYPVAETATRIGQCLQVLGYEHLIPSE